MPSIQPTPNKDSSRSAARGLALVVLLASQKIDENLDGLLERSLAGQRLDPRDRALMMELVYGVLRKQETIDWRLEPVLQKPLRRLPVTVQMLLRLGTYQLLYLTRIPHSAAVNESVNLTRSYAAELGRDWSGFINAVLRNLARAAEPAPPDTLAHTGQALSVRHGVPLWLCQRWVDRLGFERADALCKTAGSTPPVTLRVNRLVSTRDTLLARLQHHGMSAHPTSVSPVGLTLDDAPAIPTLPGFHEGAFYVEDEAAQLIPPLLDPKPDETVLDLCAAPGGKTTHLAELMENRGCLVAVDRQPARLDLLKQNCRRLGIAIVLPVLGNGRKLDDVLHAVRKRQGTSAGPALSRDHGFQRILLDAPCSGIGVLRRHPEAKWKKDEAMFHRHQRLQRDLLDAAAAVLRPGGVLVYSTCSTETEETEDVLSRFCDGHPEFERESVAPWLPLTALPFVTARGALSTMGNEFGMDGFYAARLRKVRPS